MLSMVASFEKGVSAGSANARPLTSIARQMKIERIAFMKSTSLPQCGAFLFESAFE